MQIKRGKKCLIITAADILTMYKSPLILLAIVLLASACSAQGSETFMDDFSIPFQIRLDNVPDTLEVKMYVVYGEGVDSFERMIIDSLTTNPPSLKTQSATVNGQTIDETVKLKIISVSEKDTNIEKLREGPGVVLFVGGKTHNNLTGEVYDEGLVTNETSKFSGQLMVASGKLDNDTSFMTLEHIIPPEGTKLERQAVKYSPLQGLIPEAYIPIAATGIGFFLMSFLNVFQAMFESLAGEWGKKKMKYEHTGRRILGVNVKEALAIVAASLVLGFSITWTFAGPTIEFVDLLMLNAGICLVASVSHDLVHRIFSKLFNIKVEYKFWFKGSIITVVTAFLGNSFGMQGILYDEPDEKISKWKLGITKLSAPLFSIGFAWLFASLYVKDPNVLYQMIFSTASLIAMAEIMPVKGLDGEDIRNWNRWIFLAAFMLISAAYFAMNFVQ